MNESWLEKFIIKVSERGFLLDCDKHFLTIFSFLTKHETDLKLSDLFEFNGDDSVFLESLFKKQTYSCLVKIKQGLDYFAISLLSVESGIYHLILIRQTHFSEAPSQDTYSAKENSLIGDSLQLSLLKERLTSVAETDASVLVIGESGTGKELIAKCIHENSHRHHAPMVTVNCASIPKELFESEFFGHKSGAFTGATSNRVGRFELADRGTLFLDEIGEIPFELQGKLLRALQQKSFERIGDEKTIHVDIRIIAATNRDLQEEVKKGNFREDLYYRLSVFPIEVPPLRERKSDVIPLAQHFIEKAKIDFNKPVGSLTEDQLNILSEYNWPGNIRELKNVIERAVILSTQETIRLDLALPESALVSITPEIEFNQASSVIKGSDLKRLERNNIVKALEQTGWRVSGENGAAKLLEINPSTLASKINTLSIHKPDKNSLYFKLGSIQNITRIVNELLAKLRTHNTLSRHWQNRSLENLRNEKKYLIDYICDKTGGPYKYTGRDMLDVHKEMGITSEEWDVFINITHDVLAHALDEENVIENILVLFDYIKKDIVRT